MKYLVIDHIFHLVLGLMASIESRSTLLRRQDAILQLDGFENGSILSEQLVAIEGTAPIS